MISESFHLDASPKFIITIAAFGALALYQRVTRSRDDQKLEESLSMIRRCPSCRHIMASDATSCRHCSNRPTPERSSLELPQSQPIQKTQHEDHSRDDLERRPAQAAPTAEFTAEDYLREAVVDLVEASDLMDPKTTWHLVKEGILPRVSPSDRCEWIMPMHIERMAAPESTAGQTKVKPTGDVTFSLAFVFDRYVVFMIWSGVVKTKYEYVAIRFRDIVAVNPVEYSYRWETMDGFEILHSGGRLPLLGNPVDKYPPELLRRWNRRLAKRLTGQWVASWSDDEARVQQWTRPTAV